jgi:hypothetical protein
LEFVGVALMAGTPGHNLVTVIRHRLPERVFEAILELVLGVMERQGC